MGLYSIRLYSVFPIKALTLSTLFLCSVFNPQSDSAGRMAAGDQFSLFRVKPVDGDGFDDEWSRQVLSVGAVMRD
jgi:hypothetical protein